MNEDNREKALRSLRQTRVAVIISIAISLPLSGWLLIRAYQMAGPGISPTFVLLSALWVLLGGLYVFGAHFMNYMNYRLISSETGGEENTKKND